MNEAEWAFGSFLRAGSKLQAQRLAKGSGQRVEPRSYIRKEERTMDTERGQREFLKKQPLGRREENVRLDCRMEVEF